MFKKTLFYQIKYAVFLLLFMLLDIGPVPITAMTGLYVVLFRPDWFRKMVDNIYQ